MWCLYKEVGGYYQDGLKAPDDITLLWSDDNNGNMQRLPLPSEVNRQAGAGVYYHFDYVGDPRNYKWINTISLEKTWEQMHLTYERGARQIWIVNVGDLKPLYGEPKSTQTWLSKWATREFGSAVSDATASVVDRYGINSTATFKVESDTWIIATPSSGTLKAPGDTSDQRVLITIDWEKAPTGATTPKIKITAGTTVSTISLPIDSTQVPSTFHGHIESDKTIAIEPEHYTTSTSSSTASYMTIPMYGRTLSGLTLSPLSISTQTPPSSPRLTYNIYIFTPGTATITIHLSPSLNTDTSRPLAYAIAIDDAAPTKLNQN
ncbi:hypothetical protein M7I_3827 [Glarea lozoyensis 74030]|uniref:Gylcosyl hydrolase 115 C-terminal domain-containing protein n=1 Tax=Glarea lozoyensis (strain ATCC 74030 / MF5533) TaxID=1104152 RepID=H0EMJ0_GLAL7|nr:hypothetical protein M7I_3827 [Glarea lozoyensis 74030]